MAWILTNATQQCQCRSRQFIGPFLSILSRTGALWFEESLNFEPINSCSLSSILRNLYVLKGAYEGADVPFPKSLVGLDSLQKFEMAWNTIPMQLTALTGLKDIALYGFDKDSSNEKVGFCHKSFVPSGQCSAIQLTRWHHVTFAHWLVLSQDRIAVLNHVQDTHLQWEYNNLWQYPVKKHALVCCAFYYVLLAQDKILQIM